MNRDLQIVPCTPWTDIRTDVTYQWFSLSLRAWPRQGSPWGTIRDRGGQNTKSKRRNYCETGKSFATSAVNGWIELSKETVQMGPVREFGGKLENVWLSVSGEGGV